MERKEGEIAGKGCGKESLYGMPSVGFLMPWPQAGERGAC